MKPFDSPILVTRPYMPPLSKVHSVLAEVWDNQWLTNFGPMHQRLEQGIMDRLGLDALSLFCNGTLAMEMGLKALNLPAGGEVITTPFTFVATANAIVNAGLVPVFVDIKSDDWTMDPAGIEQAIGSNTVAIAPVHVFGQPCDNDAISAIAQTHGLKLFYDAAHAFGVEVDGESVARWGDLSMFSLHATKLYHSVEGGLLTGGNTEALAEAKALSNYGIRSETEIRGQGTNAKMSELHAAVGLAMLDELDAILTRRREQSLLYRERLAGVEGITLPPLPGDHVKHNFSYMPILINEADYGLSRDDLYEQLKEENVFARRYFYPLLTETEAFSSYRKVGPLSVAKNVADSVLCLPLYHGLEKGIITKICQRMAESKGVSG